MRFLLKTLKRISIGFLLIGTLYAQAQTFDLRRLDHHQVCETSIRWIARESGVSRKLLSAMAHVESGYQGSPWPWTVNHQGKSLYFESQKAALQYIEAQLQEGDENMDIGCMQLSWKWHKAHFRSPAHALHPLTNISYAAQHLKALRRKRKAWHQAVGHYHSLSPRRAQAYIERVAQALQRPLTGI